MDAYPYNEEDDDFDQEDMDNYLYDHTTAMEDMLTGGLRLDAEKLGALRSKMPFLEDNDKVLELINDLYDNVMDTETGQRMTNAFDKLQQDRRTVAAANAVRRRKGQPEIEDRIAQRKVLDLDD